MVYAAIYSHSHHYLTHTAHSVQQCIISRRHSQEIQFCVYEMLVKVGRSERQDAGGMYPSSGINPKSSEAVKPAASSIIIGGLEETGNNH